MISVSNDPVRVPTVFMGNGEGQFSNDTLFVQMFPKLCVRLESRNRITLHTRQCAPNVLPVPLLPSVYLARAVDVAGATERACDKRKPNILGSSEIDPDLATLASVARKRQIAVRMCCGPVAGTHSALP